MLKKLRQFKLTDKQAKYTFWFMWVVVALTLAFWSLYDAGIRFNLTASMPVGVYKKTSSMPAHGNLVVVCLDKQFADMAISRNYIAPGQCPSGMQPLLKKVAALPGDEIVYDDTQGIFINNELWPHSIVQDVDSKGRPMARAYFPSVVPVKKILVLSDQHDGSFDSRYFGLVELEQVKTVTPLLTL